MIYVSLFISTFLSCFIACVFTQQCTQPSDAARFDCYSDGNATQKLCEVRGCCWKSTSPTVPFCFYPSDFPTYQVVSNQTTDFGQRFRIVKSKSTFMPNDILDLTVDLIYETQQRLRIKIYDSAHKRYEVPLDVPVVEKKADTTDYDVSVKSNPFAIVVTRKSTGTVLFDSSVAPLIYADQFIKFSTRLSSPFLYGLGEQLQPLLINITSDWKRITLWTHGHVPTVNTNLYGVHPFHVNLESNTQGRTSAHGQFLLNSNAMDVDLQPLPALTYTTIGGIIDLYIFTGPTVQSVIEQYWNVIGKPMLPPYWSLGFHLCRYGYINIENLKSTVQRMHDADFPYDVQWTDIDVMSAHLDFTYDQNGFHGLEDLVRQVQSQGKHYVNIIDPCISSNQSVGSYPPYDEGLKQGIFIRKFNSTDPIIGEVWPGQAAFPDFTHPNSTQWWTQMAAAFHQVIPFDGMWLDMNEPVNFIAGSIDGCTTSVLDNPPFTPHVDGRTILYRALCPSSEQYLSQHYNLHNMYGYFESQVSNIAMTTIRQKRPFILSRSTYAGSGKYAAHWTGDNQATYEDLYASIPAILNFNMFGVVNVGADICGFRSDTTEELCIRWMQLGAFYPFMRNHNDYSAKAQDPAVFSWKAQQIMKQALLMRYSLAPYWYTLFYQANTISTTVVRPLLFEFINDPNTYNIDKQFLVGSAILVSPNLLSNVTSVDAYIPQDTWYDFVSGIQFTTVGQLVNLNTPIEKINVHVRGGYIVPMQIPGENLILGRGNPFQLLVALSSTGSASGNLYWDDGDSLDPIRTNAYNYFEFNITSTNTLIINALMRNYTDSPMMLGIVKVLGVNRSVSGVTVNGKSFSNYLYNDVDSILTIYGLDLNILSEPTQTIQWMTVL